MSRNEKPAWASKIIHQMNVQQRDLIAMQRSLVRIEATVMGVHDNTNNLLARNRNAPGNQNLAHNERVNNSPNIQSNATRQSQPHARQIVQNMANRQPPAHPSYENVRYNQRSRNNSATPASQQPVAATPAIQQPVVPNQVRQTKTPAMPPPIAHVPVMAPEQSISMEMEENLLNLSDSE